MNNQLYPITPFPTSAELVGVGVEQNDFNRLNVRDIFNIFVRHIKLIAAVVVIVVAIVAITELSEQPRYSAQSVTKIEVLPSNGETQVAPQERELRTETQTRLMGSEALAEVVVRDLKLHRDTAFVGDDAKRPSKDDDDEDRRVVQAADVLKNSIEVKRQQQTQLISVEVGSRSAELSARIADYFPIALQKWNDYARRRGREAALAALGPQVGKTEQTLVEAQRALANARERYHMLPGAGTEIDLNQINSIANEFVSARGQSAGNSARAAGVSRSGIGGVGLAAQTSSALSAMEHRRDDLIRRQSELAVTYGDNYPELKAVNSELADLGPAMAAEASRARGIAVSAVAADAARESHLSRSEASGAAARASTLGGYLDRYDARAISNARNGVIIDQLSRDVEAKRDVAKLVAQRYRQTLSDEWSGGIIASSLADAVASDLPTNIAPRKALISALIGALVLGCLLAFAREMTDNRLRTSQQIRRRFGLPTFAMLPRVDQNLLEGPANNPVVRHPRSIFAEMARALYTDVIHLRDQTSSRVVAVTSALPGEGKSTVALSLAAAAMMMGRRTILVDLDLRRSGMLQNIQRKSGGPDLIECLTRRRSLDNLLKNDRVITLDEESDGADRTVLPTLLSANETVADPGALIASPKMEKFIDELRKRYDFVVINAPPLLAVRDAKTLSYMADDVLLVVRWAQTSIDEAEAAISTLEKAPAGVVFNDVDFAEHARRRYSDPIQFIARARDYYEDVGDFVKPGLLTRARWWFQSFRLARLKT